MKTLSPLKKQKLGGVLVVAGALSAAFGAVSLDISDDVLRIGVTVGTQKPAHKQAALLGGLALLGTGLALKHGWKI